MAKEVAVPAHRAGQWPNVNALAIDVCNLSDGAARPGADHDPGALTDARRVEGFVDEPDGSPVSSSEFRSSTRSTGISLKASPAVRCQVHGRDSPRLGARTTSAPGPAVQIAEARDRQIGIGAGPLQLPG
jgi:hypothetical protein